MALEGTTPGHDVGETGWVEVATGDEADRQAAFPMGHGKCGCCGECAGGFCDHFVADCQNPYRRSDVVFGDEHDAVYQTLQEWKHFFCDIGDSDAVADRVAGDADRFACVQAPRQCWATLWLNGDDADLGPQGFEGAGNPAQ